MYIVGLFYIYIYWLLRKNSAPWIYTHTHTHTHIYIYIYIYIYKHTHTHTHIHTYIHTYIVKGMQCPTPTAEADPASSTYNRVVIAGHNIVCSITAG